MQTIGKTVLTAAITYTTHYCITKLYSSYCIPDGFAGFIHGALTTGSPICSVVFSAMAHTQATYGTIILTTLSSAVANYLLDKDKDN